MHSFPTFGNLGGFDGLFLLVIALALSFILTLILLIESSVRQS
jgi:hypothetical protein